MKRKFIVTMDIEQDISRYLKNSYLGVEEGLEPFLGLLDTHEILMDFFVTTDVCKKYPKIIKGILRKGHKIGSHGYDHTISYYCNINYKKQFEDISKGTNEMEKIIGLRPTMFRAPNFSADGNTIKVLEQLGYQIDSSVLPGRIAKKWRTFTIYDHRNAPRVPYHPSQKAITEEGKSSIIEVPLTKNPHLKYSPLGMGYLNLAGVKRTIAAINEVKSDYVTFLIHPWELVDLKKYHPNLKAWVYDICSSDLKPLESLLEYISKNFDFTNIENVKEVSAQL